MAHPSFSQQRTERKKERKKRPMCLRSRGIPWIKLSLFSLQLKFPMTLFELRVSQWERFTVSQLAHFSALLKSCDLDPTAGLTLTSSISFRLICFPKELLVFLGLHGSTGGSDPSVCQNSKYNSNTSNAVHPHQITHQVQGVSLNRASVPQSVIQLYLCSGLKCNILYTSKQNYKPQTCEVVSAC